MSIRTISTRATDAFIYGYPMVDLYSILYKYVADPASPEYKAPLNQLYNTRRVATAEDRAIVAPNCDTPYSPRTSGSTHRPDRTSKPIGCPYPRVNSP